MKTIVMTGATNGLGAASAVQLAKQGHRLILIARDEKRGQETVSTLRNVNDVGHGLYIADMASLADVKRVAADILKEEPSIDILINNAGGTFLKYSTTAEGLETTIAVNHLAYFVLTLLLKPALKKGSRVVNTASFVHSYVKYDPNDIVPTEKGYSGMTAYNKSKLCNVLFTHELAKRWADDGITVNCLNPGFVATNFGENQWSLFMRIAVSIGRYFALTADQGGETVTFLATSATVEGVTGQYFSKNKQETPSKDARNDAYAKDLWAKSLAWAQMKET